MKELVAAAAAGEKPRLFIIDYFDLLKAFWDLPAPGPSAIDDLLTRLGLAKPTRPEEHTGRALFYLVE